MTHDEKIEALISNGLDWYVVTYDDGVTQIKHETSLSSILQCGADMADYGIVSIEQCWDGQDLSDGDRDSILRQIVSSFENF